MLNDKHEKEIRKVIRKKKLLPNIPVSLSSEVVPEMQEYERTITTANKYKYRFDNNAAILLCNLRNVFQEDLM